MHKGYRRSSDAATLLSVAALVLGFWLLVYRDGFETLAEISLAGAVLLFFSAFVFYVRAKGYPAWWSLLFFLAGPGAFLVFWVLPDRHHDLLT